MRMPDQIVDSLNTSEKNMLIKILEIEQQYRHISKLSSQIIKEISDKIVNEIEREIQE